MGILYMLSVFDSIILGVVQGITEFLPISSSGHLIITRAILGVSQEGGLAFDAVLQLATACAVILYFRKDVIDLVVNVFKGFRDSNKNKLTLYLIIGTLPALVFGLMLGDVMDTTFRNVTIVAGTLILGSVVMYVADLFLKKRKGEKRLNIITSFIIGLFQSLALLPGMSRSGMTISGGYFLGLSKEQAVRFSFLLSIPIIAGSGLLQLLHIIKNPTLVSGGFTTLSFGFVSAFIFGWISIDFFLKYLKTNTFKFFVVYRIFLAVLLLLYFIN
jgi:undecaprenyl-diphosphatase